MRPLNFEMETSCLLTLATLKGFRAGAVCAVYANRPQNEFIDEAAKDVAESDCIQTSLRAFHLLRELNEQRGGKPYWHPGLGRR